MIVTPLPGGSRIVTQADHARFAGDLLRLFRLDELVDHPRRELLLRAVAEHDNGWWEADAAPRLDEATGAVLDFRQFPAGLRQEIWQRGVERFASESPYLSALLAAHALRLSERLREDPAWTSFRLEIAARRDELLDLAGEDSAALNDDDRWLAFADSLSLAVCTGDVGFAEIPGWRLALPEAQSAGGAGRAGTGGGGGSGSSEGGGRGGQAMDVGLAPFPFAGATVFELSCRELAAERFPSSPTLGLALALSPWRRLRVRMIPL